MGNSILWHFHVPGVQWQAQRPWCAHQFCQVRQADGAAGTLHLARLETAEAVQVMLLSHQHLQVSNWHMQAVIFGIVHSSRYLVPELRPQCAFCNLLSAETYVGVPCRSVTMDAWSADQLKKMQAGGNGALNDFFKQYGVDKYTDIRDKYNNRVAEVCLMLAWTTTRICWGHVQQSQHSRLVQVLGSWLAGS